MKVHINVQEVMYLEGVTQPYIQHDTDMVKTMQDMTVPLIEADNTTHIIVYIMKGSGGEASADSPCTTDPKAKYILSGGTLKDIYGIMMVAWVKIFTTFLISLHYTLQFLIQ